MGKLITLPRQQTKVRTDINRADEAITKLEHPWLRHGLQALPLLERVIVVWHFGIGDTPTPTDEIGVRLGIPARRVEQIKEQALARLRAAANAEVA